MGLQCLSMRLLKFQQMPNQITVVISDLRVYTSDLINVKNPQYKWLCRLFRLIAYDHSICNSYTMGCPPVRGDNPRALASGLSYVQADNPWYNYFILPTSVYTLHIMIYFVLKLVRVV